MGEDDAAGRLSASLGDDVMSDGTGGRSGQRRAGTLAAGVAGIALLVSACGASSPSATESAAYQKALPFVQCMRASGVPTFPDPSSEGTFQASQVDITSTALKAYGECRHLMPAGDQVQLSPAQRQQLIDRALRFAVCMRAHGIPSFPDPTVQNGRPTIRIGPGSQIDPSSPLFQSARHVCAPILGIAGIRSRARPGTPPPAGSGS